MKKIIIKRLVYRHPNGEMLIGAQEYDGHLTDHNILGSIHEIGKTAWIGHNLWTLRNGIPHYRITVESFCQYQKCWYNILLDKIR